jgi:hypothetical protein
MDFLFYEVFRRLELGVYKTFGRFVYQSFTRFLQGLHKTVARPLMRFFPRLLQCFCLRLLEGFYKVFVRILLAFHKDVTRCLQSVYKMFTRLLQCVYKDFRGFFHEGFTRVFCSRFFVEGVYKVLSRLYAF